MARSLTPTVTLTDNTQKLSRVYGYFTIAGTGNYVAGGIPVDFTGVALTSKGPVSVRVFSNLATASVATALYVYSYVPDSNTAPTLSGGAVQVFQSAGSAAPLAEISGALPAGVTGDYIAFVAEFQRDI